LSLPVVNDKRKKELAKVVQRATMLC